MKRRTWYLLLIPSAISFLSPMAGAGPARAREKAIAGKITILDQAGQPVRSGVPSVGSQIVDVTVAPGGMLVFSPATVNISVGDTVRWTWSGSFHSVTSGTMCMADSQYCSPNDMNCSAGTLSTAGTVYQHTFNQPGTYSYFCAAHCSFGMVGTVNVSAPLQLVSAVSRKTHGAAGIFDVALPLSGEPGVECRSSGGNHTLVFTASNNLVSGNAAVTSGVGTVSGSPTFSGNTMTVELTGVSDVQRITVTLTGVTDVNSQVLADTPVSVNMLIADTTGNKTVNASDIAQTKLQSGQAVTGSNFREDVTVSGTINGSDIGLVKSRSGASLP